MRLKLKKLYRVKFEEYTSMELWPTTYCDGLQQIKDLEVGEVVIVLKGPFNRSAEFGKEVIYYEVATSDGLVGYVEHRILEEI